jgi:hypothetical protein
VHEAARDVVRRLKGTPAYVQSRRERKKVEMLFAHLKRILKLTRLRLLTRRSNDRLYDVWGLRRARFALRPNGILAVWSGSPDRKFKARLQRCGFAVDEQRVHANGQNGRRHVLWLATRPGDTAW